MFLLFKSELIIVYYLNVKPQRAKYGKYELFYKTFHALQPFVYKDITFKGAFYQELSSVSFFEKDAYGRNTRNVVHWEVVQSADEEKNTSATMANLISNALRATPEVILIGEAREPEEFEQIQRAMRTGHKTLGTFHAEDAKDAISRFASEISHGNSYFESVRMVADSIDIIISQFKFENGERKIMEISEIMGTDKDGEPIIRTLFKYNFTGRMAKDENGRVKVLGEFKQENYMSEKLKNSLYKVGIPYEQIADFCDPNDAKPS